MEKRRSCIYVTLVLFVILVVVSYISRFSDGTCVNITDWGDFGNYFNNFLTPILTIFNIIILLELTIAVSKTDKSRTQAELNLQKNLLLLQYRKEAIDRFYSEMFNFYDLEYIKDENKVEPHAVEYLKRFIELDLPFFNFGEKQEVIEREFYSLIVDLNLLHMDSRKTKKIDHERWMKIMNKKEDYLRLLRANAVGLTNADIEHLVTKEETDNGTHRDCPSEFLYTVEPYCVTLNNELKYNIMSNQNNPQPQDRPRTNPQPQTGREIGTGPRTPNTRTK